MKLNKAREILGINEDATDDEVRKVFKSKASQYHPDRNKESGAEEKFKEINEAYQVVSSGKASTREEQQEEQGGIWGGTNVGGFNIQDLFNNMGSAVRPNRKHIVAKDISIPQTLTFKEAVAGCQKDITYTHNTRCTDCNGAGQKPIDNGCSICHGTGQERIQNGYNTMIRPCQKCRGKITYMSCSTCKTEGYLSMNSTISINIPPGATNGAILNLGSRGNYMGDIMGQEQNSRLSLAITVLPQDGLEIEEPQDQELKVVHILNLTLVEALIGCSKTVPTIDGDKEVSVPPLSKHKDEIKLPRLGIARKAPQTIILNVQYPSTGIDKIIGALN